MAPKGRSSKSSTSSSMAGVPSGDDYASGEKVGKPSGSYPPGLSATKGGLLNKSGLAVNLLTTLGRTEVPATPPPILYPMATGRVVGTEVLRDRVFTGKTSVFMPMFTNMLPLNTGLNSFQSSSALQDTTVNNLMGATMKQMFGMIVRELMSTTGRVLRDTQLLESGLGESFGRWLAQYSVCFCQLRSLQSVVESGNVNLVLSLIGQTINTNLFRLEADLRRLFTFSVPPMLIEFLDRLCGVKGLDVNQPLIIAGAQFNNDPATDMTLNATIAAMLTAAETGLAFLVNGDASFPTTDAQAINNVFALAYGSPAMPQWKGPSFDEVEFAMQTSQLVTADNTVAVANFSWPNINATGTTVNLVPILVPKGYSGPALNQLFSIWRPAVYSVDPVAGSASANVASQIGLFQNQSVSNHGTIFGVYDQAGNFATGNNVAAAVRLLNFQNADTEIMYWGSEAADQVTDYTSDKRVFRDYDRVYVHKDWLVEESQYILEKMFLDPVRKG